MPFMFDYEFQLSSIIVTYIKNPAKKEKKNLKVYFFSFFFENTNIVTKFHSLHKSRIYST